MSEIDLTGYAELLAQAKRQIHAARARASLAVNTELMGLYLRLGRLILDRQRAAGRGARVIDRLSTDLRAEVPGTRGLSVQRRVLQHAFSLLAAPGPVLETFPESIHDDGTVLSCPLPPRP